MANKTDEKEQDNNVLTDKELNIIKQGEVTLTDEDLELITRIVDFDKKKKTDYHLHLFNKSRADNSPNNLLIGEFENAEDADDSWYVKVKDMNLYLVFEKKEEDGGKCPYEGKTFQALYKTTNEKEFEAIAKRKLPTYLPVKDAVFTIDFKNTTDINPEEDDSERKANLQAKKQAEAELKKKKKAARDKKKAAQDYDKAIQKQKRINDSKQKADKEK